MTRADLLAFYFANFTAGANSHGVMNPLGHSDKYQTHHEPLTPELIAGALNGETRYLKGYGRVLRSLAAVLTSPQGMARAAAIDVDDGGRAAVAQVLATCADLGLWAFAQLSEGTDHAGGHVWIPAAVDIPAPSLKSLAGRIQARAQVVGECWPSKNLLRLPLMHHLRAPGGPQRQPLLLPTGEVIDTSDPWAALARLYDEWRANSPEALAAADNALPAPTPARPQPLHKSKVNPQTDSSVIRWYCANFSLADVLTTAGVDAPARSGVVTCPFHDDKHPSLGIWTGDEGQQVCRCLSLHSNCRAQSDKALDAFNLYCIIHGLTFGEAVKRLAAEYGLGKRRRVVITQPEPAAEPRPAPTLESHAALIEAKRAQLAGVVRDAGHRRGVVTVVKAVPGLGKTHAAAALANEWHAAGLTVAVACPTKQHAADEWASRLAEPFIWRARRDACTCYPPEVIDELERKGYAVKCTDPACPYEQQRAALAGHVGIFQHNHLALNGGDLLKLADVVIIDESPVDALLSERSVTVGELAALLKRLDPNDPARRIVAALANVGRAHEKGRDLYGPDLLAALGEHVGDVAQALADARHSSAAAPHPPAPTDGDPARLPRQFLGRLLEGLAHDAAPGEDNALTTWGRSGDRRAYVWYNPRPILAAARNRLETPAIIVLDGSAQAPICERLYAPWPVDLVEIDAPLSPAVSLTQVTTGGSTRKIVENLPATIQRVAAVCNELGLTLDGGVSYKTTAPALADALGGQWMHYQGQRGRNDLAQARAVAIVASPTAPPDAIHRKARALWRDDAPIDSTWEHRGTGYYVALDPRLEAMNQAHGPEELRQSAHRLRPILAAEPCHLVVFTPWPLAPLGLTPTATIGEVPHGNSSEARAAVETYRARHALLADSGGATPVRAELQFSGQFQSRIRNREPVSISLPQIENGPKIAQAPAAPAALSAQVEHDAPTVDPWGPPVVIGHFEYRTDGRGKWQKWKAHGGWVDWPLDPTRTAKAAPLAAA